MKLVIAEKPELARDIATAIAHAPERCKLPYTGEGWTVASCAGHLMELAEPGKVEGKWEKWTLESLPIEIPGWPAVPTKSKKELLGRIERLLEYADEGVWHAGDPDDEGQLIVDEVLRHFRYKGPVMRVFVNDNLPENIRKAFKEAVPNERCEGAGRAAYARSVADFCFGANESRLASLKLHAALSIGRVQTPTLALVVDRDRAIEGHKARKCYGVEGHGSIDGLVKRFALKPKPDLCEDGKHVFEREAMERCAEGLKGAAFEAETKVSRVSRKPPLPFNLTVLISEMSRRFGFTAAQTQDATQVLRDKHHAITYNRTDSRYLKSEHFEQAEKVLGRAMRNLGASWKVDYAIRSAAFDDSKVTAHHGIIPQDASVNVESMTDVERKVYAAVVERYALQFMPPCVIEVAETGFPVDAGTMSATATRAVSLGWRAELGDNCPAEPLFAHLGEMPAPGAHKVSFGDDVEVTEKETAPPKRFTDGTLISAMAGVSRYVKDPQVKATLLKKDEGKAGEHGGIGTTATRREIIETLIKRGFVARKGKSALVSTAKGRALIDAVPEDVRGVENTAKWWLVQQDIAEGKAAPDDLQRMVVESFREHMGTAYEGVAPIAQAGAAEVGACPVCGKALLAKKASVQCSSNKFAKEGGKWVLAEGCGFSLPRKVAGKSLTDNQLRTLLAKGKTGKLKGFKSKKGKSFEASLKLVEKNGKTGVEFEF